MTDARPSVYRVNIAMAKLGVSRSTLYRLVARGELKLIKLSVRASGITVNSFEDYIRKQEQL